MHALLRLFGGIALATCALASPAGTRQASFDVGITLRAYPSAGAGMGGRCTSGATSGLTDATVSVVCSGREFVAIATRQAVWLNGSTQRFELDGQAGAHPLTAHLAGGGAVGEVTAWRAIHVDTQATVLVVQVDF